MNPNSSEKRWLSRDAAYQPRYNAKEDRSSCEKKWLSRDVVYSPRYHVREEGQMWKLMVLKRLSNIEK